MRSRDAVRLDDPFPARPPLDARPASARQDAHAIDVARELPLALGRARTALAASPSSSAADIVLRARSASSADDDNQHPPIPPPLIRLDPEPRAARDGLLTPFLLHALFLGASALGLLARRKVPAPDQAQRSTAHETAERERQHAEDRVDELQALDLLVTVCTVPEATGVDVDPHAWREGQLRHLTKLLGRLDTAQAPVSAQTVASVLHFVGFEAPVEPEARSLEAHSPSRYSLARPVLGLWAWRAYEASRLQPDAAAAPDRLEASILGAFLALLYPPTRTEENRFFFPSNLSSTTDRHILNLVSKRVLADGYTPTRGLLKAFASAVNRARRVDLLEALVVHPDLHPELRLTVVLNAIKHLAQNDLGRHDVERVSRWASRLVVAIEQLETVSLQQVRDVEVAIRRLQREFKVDPALVAPLVTDVVVALLQSPAQHKLLEGSMVIGALRHLLRSGNTSDARRLFDAIPSSGLSLAHCEALLKSPDTTLVRHAWSTLHAHPILEPTIHLCELYFAALARPSTDDATSSTRVRLATTAFRRARLLSSTKVPLDRLWHAYLSVCATHAPTGMVHKLVSRMEREDGIAPHARTAALLVEREMRREDIKVRRVEVVGAHGERDVVVERTARRGGGKAQMRRVRDTAREWSRKLAASSCTAGDGEAVAAAAAAAKRDGDERVVPWQAELDHLVLKDAVRWRREYDTAKLAVLVRARLGIDLAPLVLVAAAAGPDHDAVAAKAVAAALASPATRTLDPDAWRQSRERELKLFARGLEHRGREDLGRVLRKVLREEAARARREDLRRRKERRKEGWRARQRGGGT
ncbi:uncharacterized protein RHOBADRAFT_54333 [Rhodotorula graminis WP1]|uniref:Uncharacterized protein n=1 Tax=Rhodotorula graminis (strain WP1) TaxID=578459 RepID=A0A194S1X0_RHOGW|nr:uncharacterized protein RHOBADRAFT_54333 [Rhodotorula graminis WP1]KPV74525.1 hypothetical protein RHOBADRAFT_54333 [Rhodotorula graminis WP1]